MSRASNLRKYEAHRRKNVIAAMAILEDHPELTGTVLWTWMEMILCRHVLGKHEEILME